MPLVVRFTPSFFEELDRLLPAERRNDGTPSATDFLLLDLPAVRDRLAADFEAVTVVVPPEGDVRVCVAAGVLVERFALYAVRRGDDVAVIGISIDLESPPTDSA